MITGRCYEVLDMVAKERGRQERLHQAGRFAFTCADAGVPEGDKMLVLSEEVGEVARAAMVIPNKAFFASAEECDQLLTELVQVAAVAVAWAESIQFSKAIQKLEVES